MVGANQFLWLAKQEVQKPFAENSPRKAFPITARERTSELQRFQRQSVTWEPPTCESITLTVLTLESTIDWLLIIRHLLTFSYTASHLPLEFTIRVLPPLFLLGVTPHSFSDAFGIQFNSRTGLNSVTGERWVFRLTAASTLAGESLFGSASMEITLIMIVSTVWIGSQRSSGFS